MCLIFTCQDSHPDYPLIIAANRDEFYSREAQPLEGWQDMPGIIAGRDLLAGGSWLGVNRHGRFAAITNHRMRDEKNYTRSRGELVSCFLGSDITSDDFAEKLLQNAEDYAGYNCLFGELKQGNLQHFNNVEKKLTSLQPGIHGLSNASLDSNWFKIEQGRNAIEELVKQPLEQESWFALMKDQQQASEAELPQTGINRELELQLSPRFINLADYGTRCTTLITVSSDNMLSISERSYNENAEPIQTRQFSFSLMTGSSQA